MTMQARVCEQQRNALRIASLQRSQLQIAGTQRGRRLREVLQEGDEQGHGEQNCPIK